MYNRQSGRQNGEKKSSWMDYISEAERLKLYYKGLNEAGGAKHIAAAHPDMVSDN